MQRQYWTAGLPDVEIELGGQGRQALRSAIPEAGWKVFPGQRAQVSMLAAPDDVEKRPRPHLMHVDAFAWPRALLQVPGGHGLKTSWRLAAPGSGQKPPCGQSSHAVA